VPNPLDTTTTTTTTTRVGPPFCSVNRSLCTPLHHRRLFVCAYVHRGARGVIGSGGENVNSFPGPVICGRISRVPGRRRRMPSTARVSPSATGPASRPSFDFPGPRDGTRRTTRAYIVHGRRSANAAYHAYHETSRFLHGDSAPPRYRLTPTHQSTHDDSSFQVIEHLFTIRISQHFLVRRAISFSTSFARSSQGTHFRLVWIWAFDCVCRARVRGYRPGGFSDRSAGPRIEMDEN